MALTKELKIAVKAKIALGQTPREISAAMTDVTYQAALSLKKEYEREQAEAMVDEVTKIEPEAMQIIVEKARKEAPANIVKKLELVQDGVSGLQKLDSDFHHTMGQVLHRARSFLADEELKASEWVAITNALSTAYNNIFNNKGVNVHVDNSTQVSGTNLSMFKGSLRE